MIWRFFPTLDPQVDRVLSRYFNILAESCRIILISFARDLDSRFTEREVAAVSEWVESGASIHAMRDNAMHHVPLLGAGWGASLSKEGIRKDWEYSWLRILNDSLTYSARTRKGPDQIILTRYIWPWARNMSLQHDSYTCQYYPGSIGFPTQRRDQDYNFIAAVGNMRIWVECPEMCRRNKNWTHC